MRTLQAQVDTWVRGHGGYWEPLALLARLTEEVGELAREINHRHGPKKKRPDEAERPVADEIGDVLFILACLANREGVDLDEALTRSLEKVARRDATRWTGSA